MVSFRSSIHVCVRLLGKWSFGGRLVAFRLQQRPTHTHTHTHTHKHTQTHTRPLSFYCCAAGAAEGCGDCVCSADERPPLIDFVLTPKTGDVYYYRESIPIRSRSCFCVVVFMYFPIAPCRPLSLSLSLCVCPSLSLSVSLCACVVGCAFRSGNSRC